MPHKLERPSAALASPGDSDLGLVDILAYPGIGRAGGVGGAGELAGELPRRVKLSFNYNIAIEALAVPAGGTNKCNKERHRLWFDMPGELSAWLACSPYAACVGDDVN